MNATLVSLVIGMLAVLQGGLNRQMAAKWGLATAILINCAILIFLAGALWFFFNRWFHPQWSLPRTQAFEWQWWYAVPALCGLSLILGIPWSIPQIGALRVFLCIVVGPMALSLIWDTYIEAIPLDPKRIVGAVFAIVGLVIASWRV